MPNIPDRTDDHYDRIIRNFKQAKQKIKKLDDVYIDSTNNKQVLKDIRDILIDIGQIFKTMNGVQRDDDVT